MGPASPRPRCTLRCLDQIRVAARLRAWMHDDIALLHAIRRPQVDQEDKKVDADTAVMSRVY